MHRRHLLLLLPNAPSLTRDHQPPVSRTFGRVPQLSLILSLQCSPTYLVLTGNFGEAAALRTHAAPPQCDPRLGVLISQGAPRRQLGINKPYG